MKSKENGIVRHLIVNSIVLLSIMLVIMVLSQRENFARQMQQVNQYIKELSERTSQHVGDVFADKSSAISSIAYLYGNSLKSPQVDLESLGELEETSGFDWIRFIDREGSDYTSNGKFAEVSDREYYQEGIAGKSGICIVMKSRVNQKRLVGFYAPVYYQGKVCGVMVGFLQESTVSQILATELYGSNVGTMIVDISGTVLGKDGKKETADIEMIDDILPLLDENEQQSVKNALKNKDKTQYDYTDEMGSSVGYLVPIKGTDWMLMQSFPTDVVQKFAKKVTNDERLAMSAFGLVLAIFVFRFVYLIKRKKRLDREKSNRDKVTSLLQNVSDDYICLIDVNLETEIEEQFPMHGGRDLGDWAKGNYDYTHCIGEYARAYVCEKDRDTFLCATCLELLKKIYRNRRISLSNMML